jgi:hypothetical protein
MSDLHQELRVGLLALPGVETRKMFGAEAYFVGPSMFAFFTPTSLVHRETVPVAWRRPPERMGRGPARRSPGRLAEPPDGVGSQFRNACCPECGQAEASKPCPEGPPLELTAFPRPRVSLPLTGRPTHQARGVVVSAGDSART